jgi:CDP-6-deoxy-D-xylo-4-hexulose-3-dehydrase
MSGAIGVQQLKKVPEILRGRRLNASYFVDKFSDIPELKIQKEVGQSSWFGFSFILEGKLSGRRKEVVSSLMSEGIDCRPIVAGNFTKNPVMKHLNSIVPDHLPAADKVHVDGLFVGNHHYEIFEEIDLLHKVLTSVI